MISPCHSPLGPDPPGDPPGAPAAGHATRAPVHSLHLHPAQRHKRNGPAPPARACTPVLGVFRAVPLSHASLTCQTRHGHFRHLLYAPKPYRCLTGRKNGAPGQEMDRGGDRPPHGGDRLAGQGMNHGGAKLHHGGARSPHGGDRLAGQEMDRGGAKLPRGGDRLEKKSENNPCHHSAHLLLCEIYL